MDQKFYRRLAEMERVSALAQQSKRTTVSLDRFYEDVETAMRKENFERDPRESWMESYARFIGIPYRSLMDSLKAGLN